MTKPRLQTLKPRLTVLKADRLPTIQPGSWRSDKSSSTARGYGYRWQQARERFLQANPLCVHCGQEGVVTVATVVDHIEPHRGDDALFWNEANWQALCASHHNQKTAGGR